MSWELVNLANVVATTAPEPRWAGLVYPGARHLWSGEPEAAKSLAADIVLLDAIRTGGGAILIDLEMGAASRRARLVDLGATLEELAAIVYVEPEGPPTADDLEAVLRELDDQAVDRGDSVAVIDAAATAFSITGLDDHARKDVETFAARWVAPLRAAGVATILVDHVAKARDTRGRFAFGSERKVGAVDVHLGFEIVTPLRRGHDGLVRVVTHKDRLGYLSRPRAAELELRSDPATHAITWTWRTPSADVDEWLPTQLMESVSRYLERHPDGANRSAIYRDVRGKRDYLIVSVDKLLELGYTVEFVPGKQGTPIVSTKPFRVDSSPSSPVVPDGSRNESTTFVPPSPPPSRGDGDGDDSDQDELERLAAKHADLLDREPEPPAPRRRTETPA